MPKRPGSHQLEEQSRARLKTVFADQGWTSEDLRHDYGEDLLVLIFADGVATEYSFYVQLKATARIDQYLTKKAKYLSYPINTTHLEYWSRFWEPVLLILWDAKGRRFYWECIQTAVDESSLPRSSQQKTVSIAIPTANTLNEQGIRRIVARTKKRFNRFAREKQGAEHLLKFLRTTLNLDIIYEPQEGFIQIPQGRFLPKKDGGKICRVFGKMAEMIAVIESKFGLTTDEAVKLSLEHFLCTYEDFRRDGKIEQRDKDGNTVRSWNTFKEYLEDREREQELDEADS